MNNLDKIITSKPGTREMIFENFEIALPTKEQLETESMEKLHDVWRENHQKIFKKLQEVNPRYFGWHGTNKEAIDKILLQKNSYLEITAFQEKEYENESFLYQLYAAAAYVRQYASKRSVDSTGKIIVLNLESANGQQIACTSDHLKPPSVLGSIELTFQSNLENEEFAKLDDAEHLLYHTAIALDLDNSKKDVVGVIDLEREYFKKTIGKLDLPDSRDGARYYLQERFLAQGILFQTLELMNGE
jgi:hypothetical protein